jgi:hypothetical protein
VLIRLILLIIIVGGGVAAFRWWRLQQMLAAKRIGDGELKRLAKIGRDMPLLVEALEVRQKIHSAGGADALLDDVDAAVRTMGDQAKARLRLAGAIADLDGSTSDEKLAELEVEASTTNDPHKQEVFERKLAQAERQRKTADDMRSRQSALKAAQEKLVLELKDVHLALLEHNAQSADGPETQLLRERLNDASEEMRLRAQAMDEVKGLLAAAEE